MTLPKTTSSTHLTAQDSAMIVTTVVTLFHSARDMRSAIRLARFLRTTGLPFVILVAVVFPSVTPSRALNDAARARVRADQP